jgi:lipoyl-dependent peroxiredoxin
MTDVQRRAVAVWEGSLVRGTGVVTLSSGAATPLPVTWASRTARFDGKTSPE